MDDLNAKLTRFEEHYHYLESSFIDTIRIIPMDNDTDTFSPRLYEILQSTCSQIEGILHLMHNEFIPKKNLAYPCDDASSTEKEQTSHACKGTSKKKSAADIYKCLNQNGVISSRVLMHNMRSGWKETMPFLCDFECMFRKEDDDLHMNSTCNKMPKWWKNYNKSKHELPQGYTTGSIKNAYLALAGLYVLHVMARKYSRDAHAFTQEDRWITLRQIAIASIKNPCPKPIVIKPSSEIFIPKIVFLNDG